MFCGDKHLFNRMKESLSFKSFPYKKSKNRVLVRK